MTDAADAADTEVPKPLLRGWLHLVCFFLSLPVGAWLVAGAADATARTGAVVYATGLAALFGVSGLYHCGRWGAIWRRRMSRLDHSTIFVMIAGSYTPLCLVILDGAAAVRLLVAVWFGAAIGAALCWRSGRRAAQACGVLYLVLGWLVVVTGPQLLPRIGAGNLALLGLGGVLFTIGACTLAARRPDPFPRVFGYHEVWHVFVVAAVVCQLRPIAWIIRTPGLG